MGVSSEKKQKIQNDYAPAAKKTKILLKAIESIANGKLNESEACVKYKIDKMKLRRFLAQDFSSSDTENDHPLNTSNLKFDHDWREVFMARLLNVNVESNVVPIVKDFDELYDEITKMALTERQIGVLSMRVKEDMTQDAIASDLGITRERVRQIESKCYDILRNPKYVYAFLHGQYLTYLDNTTQVISKAEKRKLMKHSKIYLRAEQAKELSENGDYIITRDDITTRVFNALARHGCLNIRNIEKFTVEELSYMRNLGVTSAQQIESYMKSVHGITLGHGGDKSTMWEKIEKLHKE